MGEPHADDEASAREKLTLSARPLRDRCEQGARLPDDAPQNQMFRANASGSLRDLLIGVLKDPAMLVYLDNGENVKGHPNENFGRELLELFTWAWATTRNVMFVEAARAFTRWTNNALDFRFDAPQHHFGEKVFLGRTGDFNGEDVIDAILQRPVQVSSWPPSSIVFRARGTFPAPSGRSWGGRFETADIE